MRGMYDCVRKRVWLGLFSTARSVGWRNAYDFSYFFIDVYYLIHTKMSVTHVMRHKNRGRSCDSAI